MPWSQRRDLSKRVISWTARLHKSSCLRSSQFVFGHCFKPLNEKLHINAAVTQVVSLMSYITITMFSIVKLFTNPINKFYYGNNKLIRALIRRISATYKTKWHYITSALSRFLQTPMRSVLLERVKRTVAHGASAIQEQSASTGTPRPWEVGGSRLEKKTPAPWGWAITTIAGVWPVICAGFCKYSLCPFK